jgi:hypothetical protein
MMLLIEFWNLIIGACLDFGIWSLEFNNGYLPLQYSAHMRAVGAEAICDILPRRD